MASPLGLTDYSGIAYSSSDGDVGDVNFTGGYNSILNGSKFYYRPTASMADKTSAEQDTNSEKTDGSKNSNKIVFDSKSSKRHQPDNSQDDLYDISTNSIINYTSNEDLPALKLKAADFGYLRDLGVYPNNRLVVCRRFPSPVENDLTAVKMSPISSVVSWVSDSEDSFFSFKSSESWESHTTADPLNDLTDIFNSIFSKATGIDVKSEGAGVIGGIAGAFPVGGVAEALETEITNYLLGRDGEDGTNFSYKNLHVGNPNFMGESSFREINSIKSEVSIPVKTEYELKYYPNVDPTIVFMDLVQNLLRFSSSESVFYLAQSGGSKVNEFFNKFGDGDWIGALSIILNGIIEAITKIVGKVSKIIDKVTKVISDVASGESSISESVNKDKLSAEIKKGLKVIGDSAMARYRIEFSKIIPSASGASSAPWHITIGNPKNPFFSSGDMIVEGGEVKFGNTLGFNDLPTRIEYNFTIRTARNLGIQEIFDKFNIGAGRQYQRNSIVFESDFYQGDVKKGTGDQNPVTGAKNNSVGTGSPFDLTESERLSSEPNIPASRPNSLPPNIQAPSQNPTPPNSGFPGV